MRTIAVFGGSKDVPDSRREELDAFLDGLFRAVSGNVERVLYGGGKYGVMGRIFEKSQNFGIETIGYSLTKYRRTDDDEKTKFFENDDERVHGFYKDGGAFLVLPGGFGTIKEVLQINDLIKRNSCGKKIYIPPIFSAFYELVENLGKDGMIADEDEANFVKLDNMDDLVIPGQS